MPQQSKYDKAQVMTKQEVQQEVFASTMNTREISAFICKSRKLFKSPKIGRAPSSKLFKSPKTGRAPKKKKKRAGQIEQGN